MDFSCKQITFVVVCIVSFVCNSIGWFVYMSPYVNEKSTSTVSLSIGNVWTHHRPTVGRLNNDTEIEEKTVKTNMPIMKEGSAAQDTLIEEYRKKLQMVGFTMNSFLLPYKVKSLKPQRRTNKFYNSCAIVGSGGILTDSHCGEEISSHEFVVRQNMAPTDGFEKDVGSRTDLMSLNLPTCVALNGCLKKGSKDGCYKWTHELDKLKESIVLLSVFHAPSVPWRDRAHLRFLDLLKKKHLRFDVRVSAKNTTLRLESFWNLTKHPSAGLRCVTMAIAMCRSISLYGFYPFSEGPDGEPLRYHYFDDKSWNKKIHNMSEEHLIYRHLGQTRTVRLVNKKCKIT